MKRFLVLPLFFAFILIACGSSNEIAQLNEVTRVIEVEVTRLVEVSGETNEVENEVEVTREVEVPVEVTRIVVATPTEPPPTPTPEEPELGTREMPYPVGTVATLIAGSAIEFEFTIVEVLRGDAAWQRIVAANSFNDPAPPGEEWILFRALVSYNGPDQGILELDVFNTSIVTKGRILDYFDVDTPCCLEPSFDFQLLQGGSGEGWLAYPVPIDDPDPLFLLGDAGGIYFSLTP